MVEHVIPEFASVQMVSLALIAPQVKWSNFVNLDNKLTTLFLQSCVMKILVRMGGHAAMEFALVLMDSLDNIVPQVRKGVQIKLSWGALKIKRAVFSFAKRIPIL